MATKTEILESESLDKKADDPWHWALPAGLDVPDDPLQLRLDFHSQVVVLRTFPAEGVGSIKMVSAVDVAHALASELTVTSGMLPLDALWWSNTRQGAAVALWREPKTWRVALQEEAGGSPQRYTIPMPGLIFICTPGRTPWIFAAKRRPSKPTDKVYRAPAFNVFADGRVCPGTHTFPEKVSDIPESFFRSFFSPTGDLNDRSKAYKNDLKKRWETLDGREKYPMNDLMEHSRVEDLLNLDLEAPRW